MKKKSATIRTNADEERLDFYIDLTCAAISLQYYKEALFLISKGLESSLTERRRAIRKLLHSFYDVVANLNLNLQEAYGNEWEDKIGIPKIYQEEEKEVSCSF